MRRCMLPGCRKPATFEVEVEPLPKFDLTGLQKMAGMPITAGTWRLCTGHAADLTQRTTDAPDAELWEYDVEHDPRAYVR